MNTIRILALLSLTVVFGEAARRPNVVLFLVDDMGWIDSTVYGSKYYETPNMERLAKQSMRFTDAYAVPLCSPTRASILSGQYSSRHGITSASGHRPPADPKAPRYGKAAPNKLFIYADSKNYLEPGLITLAEVLRDAGYRTGHFGKWHLGLLAQYRPEAHGFETSWHCAPDPGPPSYFSPYGVHKDGRPTAQHHVGNITDGPAGEYITDRLTDEAVKFIETHRQEPFFLNLWQYGVHGPWGHKEEYTRAFAKKKDPRGKQSNAIMASMLKSVDQSLGRIMAKLDELGLTEDTLFIFYSDNGGNTHSNTPDSRQMTNIKPGHPKYAFVQDWKKWAGDQPPTNNEPLREGKGRIYEGGQRVPLMVRWPGHIKAGSLTDAVVGPIDLYPTILDALKLKRPKGHIIDGESILPLLRGVGGLKREALFTWFPHLIPAVSVRRGDYKLIRRWEPHPIYPEVRELYNLKDDIGETKNLAADKPGLVKELETLIDGFIAETSALAPKPNPTFQPKLAETVKDPVAGLVPKMCKVEISDDALRMTGDGRTPFLGTAQVKFSGPMTLHLRVRSARGGKGWTWWKLGNQEQFPEGEQTVAFEVRPGSDWQDISVPLPVQGQVGIMRLYLPVTEDPVEIQSIRFEARDGRKKAWDFAKASR